MSGRCVTNFNYRERVSYSLLSTVIPTIHTCLDNFVSNTVVYTGTHDNAPTREWYEELPDYQRQNFWNYLNRAPGGSADAASSLIGLAWSSKAALAIAPLQDVLNLGAESRMNVPGRAAGNWRWRCREDMLSQSAFEWLRNLTETTKRSGALAGYFKKEVWEMNRCRLRCLDLRSEFVDYRRIK